MGENHVEPLTDLELSLGASNQCIRTRSIIKSGAGVNAAASRLSMTFVASDPLSELVWSPNKGLSLKCADFSFTEKKPRNFWDLETSNMILSLQGNSPSETANKNPVIEENMTISQADEQSQLAKSHSLIPASDPRCIKQSAAQEYEREVDLKLCTTSDLPQQELLSNSTPLSGKGKEGEIQKVMLLSRSGSEQAVLEVEKTNLPKFSNPENITPMVNQEFASESGLWLLNDKIGSEKELSPPDRRNKGKEKALSIGDFNNRALQDVNDNHDSIESCNSADFLSKGNKRWVFEHQVIAESKRPKRDIDEISASSSFPRQDSSFMNWVSNVVKGLYKSGEANALIPFLPPSLINTGTQFENYDRQIIVCTKDPEPEPEPVSASRIAGFQTMFQSIYCSNPKDNEKGESNDEEDSERFKELVQIDNSHKPSSLLKGKFIESTSEVGKAPFNSENLNINMISGTAHNSEPLENLWISRFSPKAATVVAPTSDHQVQRPEKELECPLNQIIPIIDSPDDQLKLELGNSLDDGKSVHHFSSVPPSPKINSEAMASVFARRLVAIKQITPLDAETEESEVETRKHGSSSDCCLDTSKTELKLGISSSNEKEPIVFSPARLNPTLDWKISSEKRESSPDVHQKLASCSGDDALEPLRKHAKVPAGVIEFIKKLRLTRMDIFKWINSGQPLLKLNGYFLRLRLGKKEGELGGSGYQVGFISGEQKEDVQKGSKVTLSVFVGGTRYWVDSQYISNNDFLEDEFMVWWLSTVKTTTHDTLLDERLRLGF